MKPAKKDPNIQDTPEQTLGGGPNFGASYNPMGTPRTEEPNELGDLGGPGGLESVSYDNLAENRVADTTPQADEFGAPGAMNESSPVAFEEEEEMFVLLDLPEESQQKQPATPTQILQGTRYGVAIGHYHVTIAATEFGPNGAALVDSASAEIAGDGHAALTLALRDAAKKLQSRPRSVDLVLPASICEYQVVSLPAMDAKVRNSYIAQLARKALKDKEACYAGLSLAQSKTGTELLLVVAPREEVENIVRACHKAGLVPDRAVPPFLPALSLLSIDMEEAQEAAAMIDQLASDEMNLIVWDDGKLRVLRNIRKDSSSDRWEEFLDSEVYRTVAYYRTRSGGRRVQRLYLATNEDTAVMQERFQSAGMFESGVKQLAVQGIGPAAHPLTPLAAAAASLARSQAPRIDLLPFDLRNPKRKQLLTMVSLGLAALFFLAQFAGYFLARAANHRREQALAAIGEFASGMQVNEANFRTMEAEKSSFTKQVDFLDGKQRNRIPLSAVLASVLSAPMKQIYLKGMDVKTLDSLGAFEVILHGACDENIREGDGAALKRFVEGLNALPGSPRVESVPKSKTKIRAAIERTEFEVHLTYGESTPVEKKP